MLDSFIGENRSIENQIQTTPEPKTLQTPDLISETQPEPQPNLAAQPEKEIRIFDLNIFVDELYNNSATRNKHQALNSKHMSAYDICNSCIKSIVYKLKNTPVEHYAHKWLPILLRAELGKACHEFIQSNSNQFTEQECSLKIPSIRTSVRIDCLINDNILVEVKSLPYKEYRKIIKTRTPRLADFYQALAYKMLICNPTYLKEAQSQPRNTLRTDPPKLNSYDITHLQFIYLANDLLTSETESLSEANREVTHIKQLLSSKNNPFFFLSNIVVDLRKHDLTDHYNYIENKIKMVNHYIDTNTEPLPSDNLMDDSEKNCHFCLYSSVCSDRK